MSADQRTHKALSSSFPALAGQSVHTLILGTMPGKKSLHENQYYAHPRNALWPILCALIDNSTPSYTVHQQIAYPERCRQATQAGFALWDVLASCYRPGSLDTNIERESEQANDIGHLARLHPELHTIVCNGRSAEALFKRHIRSQFGDSIPRLLCLPSTSPAMASLSLQAKHDRWKDALTASL